MGIKFPYKVTLTDNIYQPEITEVKEGGNENGNDVMEFVEEM